MLGDNYTAGVYSFVLDDDGSGAIGETTLSNFGTTYTATTGDVAGLSLNLSTGADDTTIYVGRSLLDTLSNFTNNILANSGKIADKIFELNSDLNSKCSRN